MREGDRVTGRGKRRYEKLSTLELARFLKKLSALYRDPMTGNTALSEALSELAAALGKRSEMPIDEAVWSASEPVPRAKRALDFAKFRSLGIPEVRGLLADDELTKAELVALGAERFAISRSRLERSNRSDIVEIIWAALRHEESLGIISREARRGGSSRSS